MASAKNREEIREKLIKSYDLLINLIKKFLTDKVDVNINDMDSQLLISKLTAYIDSFQVSKIQGLRMFVKHIKNGFTPTEKEAERFIKQIEELSEIFDPSKPEKIKRIVEIIQSVTENIIKYSYEEWAKSHSKTLVETAKRIQRVTEYMANLNDLDGIYNYYLNLVKDFEDSKIGKLLSTYNKNEFKSEFNKVQEIYFMK
ncbi:MAG: hypothetical protein ACTSWR_07525 [Candidatus Helarchaeota archaeon]